MLSYRPQLLSLNHIYYLYRQIESYEKMVSNCLSILASIQTIIKKAALDYNGMLSGFGEYSDIDI